MFNKIVLPIILILLLSISCSAIGITPTRFQVSLKPGQSQTVTIDVIRHTGTQCNIYPIGDPEFIAAFASKGNYQLPNKNNNILLTFNYPTNISRGGYFGGQLVFEEMRPNVEGAGARAAVGAPVSLLIQFIGKYAGAQLDAKDTKLNQPVPIALKITNFGTENIASASGTVSIFDNTHNKIGEVSTQPAPLAPMQSTTFNLTWDSNGYTKGNYYAEAYVTYDEKSATANDTFKIGTLNLKILNFSDTANQDTVNSFYIKVENEWNDPLENLFADVTLKNISGQVASFSISEQEINAWQVKNMKGFFNAQGIQPGDYDANILLAFNEVGITSKQHSNASGKIKVLPYTAPVKNETKETPKTTEAPTGFSAYLTMTNILMFILLIFFIINILIFILKRKKEDKKDEKPQTTPQQNKPQN
jgi:hypothetical protein